MALHHVEQRALGDADGFVQGAPPGQGAPDARSMGVEREPDDVDEHVIGGVEVPEELGFVDARLQQLNACNQLRIAQPSSGLSSVFSRLH